MIQSQCPLSSSTAWVTTKMMVWWKAAVVVLMLETCSCGYIITTPSTWVEGTQGRVCVEVDDPAAPAGHLTLSETRPYRYNDDDDYEDPIEITSEEIFPIPAGIVSFCQSVDVTTHKNAYRVQMWMRGQVGGAYVNRTMSIYMRRWMRKTFIQTDKYLYNPGQKVQMRVLSMYLNNLTVTIRQYPVVWVTTPSNTRIAQWNNVDNTDGLIHLEMTLADEPEKGQYNIHVEDFEGNRHNNHFKVQEYVVPRFEVTIHTPKAVLSSDDTYLVRLCARYTYGQPVKGNFTVQFHNSRTSDCSVARNITGTMIGCHDVKVTSASLRVIDCSVYRVSVSARVSEAGTGVTEEADTHLQITRRAITFTKIHQDDLKKPGLPYTLKVRVEEHDGTPAAGTALEVCKGDVCSNVTVPHDGIITVHPRKDQFKTVRMKALSTRVMLDESSFSAEIDRYYSPSNSSLLIRVPADKLECSVVSGGESQYIIPVFFVTDQSKATFTVQVMSRYTLQHYTKTQELDLVPGDLPISSQEEEPLEEPPAGTVRGVVNIPLVINQHIFSPAAKVIVWMVRPDGEVVSDAKMIRMEGCLPNKAELDWSQETAEPGHHVDMKLTSTPHSLCSLGVVDKGTMLLDTRRNLLTIDAIFSNLDLSPSSRYYYHNDHEYCKNKFGLHNDEEDGMVYFTRFDDASKILENYGLLVVSNLMLETRPCEKYKRVGFGGMFYDGSDSRVYAASSSEVGFSDTSTTVATIRSHFPETWLWNLHIIPASGVYSERVTLPDTITEWVGQAVCVNPATKGLGLSTLTNITTFTPFFLDLTLPPSLKRGETLPVLISIFNYIKVSLPVIVEVHGSPEYEIVREPSSQRAEGVLEACVPGNSKVVLQVKVKPTTLGEVNITVEARVDYRADNECGGITAADVTKRDALVKPITVKAEGFPQEKTWNKYICAKDLSDGSDALERWEVSAPEGIVEGSDRGWVTVVGNLLTVSLENLGHLIRMPYGCGEQNMINFAPNVFILQYLTTTRQANTNHDAVAKLTRHMNKGYQRQLLYLRGDGSYSAFGNADTVGSSWLTAFVLKSLSQAQPFITIDSGSLNRSIEWLKETQGTDGCFTSVGQVFNKALKGGMQNQGREELTSYVLISLLEAGVDPSNITVTRAATCLLSLTPLSSRPHYSIALRDYVFALKAYALALAGAVEAQETVDTLLSLAIVTSNSTHWHLPEGYNSRGNALSVETAGYAILAMMTLDTLAYQEQVRKVVKWITVQRNGQGGFYTTQDTVVALQALAKYESTQHQDGLDFVATVKGRGIDHSFAVDEDNKLVTQSARLTTLPTTLTLSMLGRGCAVIQSVLRYNSHEPKGSDTFSLQIKTHTASDTTCTTKWISVCSTYHLAGVSNMVVVSLGLVSGYAPLKDDLKKVIGDNPMVFKRYEVDGSEVNFYVEEMFEGGEVCFKTRVERLVDVEGAKPGSVTIYDYYQPELTVSKIYTFPPSDECVYSS